MQTIGVRGISEYRAGTDFCMFLGYLTTHISISSYHSYLKNKCQSKSKSTMFLARSGRTTHNISQLVFIVCSVHEMPSARMLRLSPLFRTRCKPILSRARKQIHPQAGTAFYGQRNRRCVSQNSRDVNQSCLSSTYSNPDVRRCIIQK